MWLNCFYIFLVVGCRGSLGVFLQCAGMWNICKFDATFWGLLCFSGFGLLQYVFCMLCHVPRLPHSKTWTLKLCRRGDTYLHSGGAGEWDYILLTVTCICHSQLVLDPGEVLPKVESLGTRLHVLCSGWLMQHNVKNAAFYKEMWLTACSWHCPCGYDSSTFLNFFFFLSILFPFLMQLAVDLEVLRVIARTRMEIKAIRSKYTAMKAEREYLSPGILVDTLHQHCTIHTIH